jgi:selenocysteine lyase/cysteine desulfurase
VSRLSIVGAGVEVPVSHGRTVGYANLDYAASAPCLTEVRDAVVAALPLYSSVHRGAGYLSQLTTRRYEDSREILRAFTGARPDDAVILTRNTTDAMNLLARALPADTTVVVFDTEHHATLLPWKRAIRLPAPETPAAAVAAVAHALATAPAGPRLLAVTAASNVTGELWPIAELAAAAHAHGARIAVDVAQLAPHRPLDLVGLGIDYAALSGHKLYAPFGAGCLIGRPDWLCAADPYLRGGGATTVVDEGGVTWAADPEHRHEGGSPNVIGALALAAACAALRDWEPIVTAEERLLDRLRTGLAALPGVCELSLWGSDHPRVGIVSFTVDGWDSRDLAETLSHEYGIGVRDGKFCAHLFVRHLTGATAGQGHACGADRDTAAIRVSIGLGTTEEHIDRLLTALVEQVGGQVRSVA